jgi:hypothetical protein
MLLLAALTLASQVSPNSTPARPLQTADGEKVECRLIQEVHSRIPTRICRTEAEWARIAKETESDLANSRNDRTVGCRGMLGC